MAPIIAQLLSGLERVLSATPGALAVSAGYLGVVFHALFVRRLFVEEYLYPFLGGYALAAGSLVSICLSFFNVRDALLKASVITTAFTAGLYFSMSIYRLFLHRLRKFPGPWGAKLSRFYVTAASAKKVMYHKEIKQWHEKYGDFIRTGPRELAIVRKSAVQQIYGPASECVKSSWYTQVSSDHTKISIHMTRDWNDHKQRRKAWDRGFSVKAMNTYEPRIASKVELLLDQIKSHIASSKPLDATMWSNLLTFDIMGEVGFGKDFKGLETGIEHPAIKGIHDHMTALGILATVPWFLNLLARIPGASAGYAPFFSWCHNEVRVKQMKYESEKYPQDIISWLIKAYNEKDVSAAPSEIALHEDSRAVIIAGSDTTASTLAEVLFFFSKYPAVQKKLQAKLDAAMPHREWSYEKAKSVGYVEDIIQETLRLKPALLTGGYRTTPANGIFVDGVHIPGNTNVFVPMQLMQTDPRYHPQADEFIPERFGERRVEWKTDQQPWYPFSIGPYSCPGKVLAMVTLRMAISQISLHYDVSFAPGEDGEKFDSEALDTFTTTLPPLMVQFTPRR
ncbi:cytochrome p450 [Neofusicoccum parvum]|uniref:Cytochrome p450 n=1 Tax=Neofusicoccum parvum TaxID=310453 RepID=A0ACB5S4E3_9PEZI|nr:cytochrome p450 [Neofusicoccum parvum]